MRGEVVLHDGPGGHRCDCSHAPFLDDSYIRLHIKEDGIKYPYDVCSMSCLEKICREKDIEVELTGRGNVPVEPHSRKRKPIRESE